jgi:condensin complex subunit 3
MSVDGSEIGEEDEDDTMLAGMQAEGTRMPLESEGEEEEDEEEEDELPTPRKPYQGVTEDDIMESLLASEM